MSSVHCIVVWEYQSQGQWLPHTPGVTRTLERAHAKKLTRVVLADADPILKGHFVNLRTLTQSRDTPDGGSVECLVRRSCYSVQSVGGRGARWEWARFTSPPLPAELNYEPMPMEMQCVVESAWMSGHGGTVWEGWAVRGGAARRGGELRVLRRLNQPPYPLTRAVNAAGLPPHGPSRAPHTPPPPQLPPAPHHRHTQSQEIPGVVPRIPQQRTGPPPPPPPPRAAPPRGGARSASPRDRKHNLARQILHNLNIFSTVKPPPAVSPRSPPPPPVSTSEGECGNRRHSVDTVSTYLSHESKDSLQRGSVGELLNCSGGSDEVFFTSSSQHVDTHTTDTDEDDNEDEGAAPAPAWGLPGGGGYPRGTLAPSSHRQPPGTMAWRLQHVALPHYNTQTSILVTYNFQSGVQGPDDPEPGAPYYAVGFPRHSVLPDDRAGRQVLSLVRVAWEAGVLFALSRSRTTGREHVVRWAAPPPPPAAPAHCEPRAVAAAARAIHHLLHHTPTHAYHHV